MLNKNTESFWIQAQDLKPIAEEHDNTSIITVSDRVSVYVARLDLLCHITQPISLNQPDDHDPLSFKFDAREQIPDA